MKRFTSVVAVLLLVGVVLSGCGSGQKASEEFLPSVTTPVIKLACKAKT